MSDSTASVDIPDRALFKAAEVCELLKVQPYVLRSWESEFHDLGVAKTPGGPRVYRRSDVEQVLRIKHLLLVEGLTLAGARRKLEDESSPVAADAPVIDELLGRNARERLTEVKRGLRAILDLLSARVDVPAFQLTSSAVRAVRLARDARPAGAPAPKGGKAKAASRSGPAPRRKRSA